MHASRDAYRSAFPLYLSFVFLIIQKVSKVQALQRGRRGRRRAGEAVEERKRLQASVTVSRMIVGYHGRRYDFILQLTQFAYLYKMLIYINNLLIYAYIHLSNIYDNDSNLWYLTIPLPLSQPLRAPSAVQSGRAGVRSTRRPLPIVPQRRERARPPHRALPPKPPSTCHPSCGVGTFACGDSVVGGWRGDVHQRHGSTHAQAPQLRTVRGSINHREMARGVELRDAWAVSMQCWRLTHPLPPLIPCGSMCRDIEWLDALRVLRRGSKLLRQVQRLSRQQFYQAYWICTFEPSEETVYSGH